MDSIILGKVPRFLRRRSRWLQHWYGQSHAKRRWQHQHRLLSESSALFKCHQEHLRRQFLHESLLQLPRLPKPCKSNRNWPDRPVQRLLVWPILGIVGIQIHSLGIVPRWRSRQLRINRFRFDVSEDVDELHRALDLPRGVRDIH